MTPTVAISQESGFNNLKTNGRHSWHIKICINIDAEYVKHNQQDRNKDLKMLGGQTEAVADNRTWTHTLLTLNTCDSAKWNAAAIKKKKSMISHAVKRGSRLCYLIASLSSLDTSAIHCPLIPFVYQCPNCSQPTESEWGVVAEGLRFSCEQQREENDSRSAFII